MLIQIFEGKWYYFLCENQHVFWSFGVVKQFGQPAMRAVEEFAEFMLKSSYISVLEPNCIDVCLLGKEPSLINRMIIADIDFISVHNPIPINLINLLELVQFLEALLILAGFYIRLQFYFGQNFQQESYSHFVIEICSDSCSAYQCDPYILIAFGCFILLSNLQATKCVLP